jgi:DNA-binding Xre family transcriptional regulator
MNQTLIRWTLKEIMARYDIKAGDLAKLMGISGNSIANLRKAKTMPRLDGNSLNNLCNALNLLAQDLDKRITPADLINYTPDLDTFTPPGTSSTNEDRLQLSPKKKHPNLDDEAQGCLTAA